jgi:hypothetical protein
VKDFVSQPRASIVALAASMSIVCALFVPYGRPWTALAWASLALLPVVLRGMKADVEAALARVVATRTPDVKLPKAVV